MNETKAMSYLAEIIDAARAGGAPREYIQALQMAREALDAARSLREAIDISKTGVSRGGTNNA